MKHLVLFSFLSAAILLFGVEGAFSSCQIFSQQTSRAKWREWSHNENTVSIGLQMELDKLTEAEMDPYTRHQIESAAKVHPQLGIQLALKMAARAMRDDKFPVFDNNGMRMVATFLAGQAVEIAPGPNAGKGMLSLVFFDVKQFKLVNDVLKYAQGDATLRNHLQEMIDFANKEISEIVKSSGREGDVPFWLRASQMDSKISEAIRMSAGEVGRFGGDELIVLIRGNESDAKAYLKRVQDKINGSDFLKRLNRKILEVASNNSSVAEYLERSIQTTNVSVEMLAELGITPWEPVFQGERTEMEMNWRVKLLSGVVKAGSVGGGIYEFTAPEVQRLAKLKNDLDAAAEIFDPAVSKASENGDAQKKREQSLLGLSRAQAN